MQSSVQAKLTSSLTATHDLRCCLSMLRIHFADKDRISITRHAHALFGTIWIIVDEGSENIVNPFMREWVDQMMNHLAATLRKSKIFLSFTRVWLNFFTLSFRAMDRKYIMKCVIAPSSGKQLTFGVAALSHWLACLPADRVIKGSLLHQGGFEKLTQVLRSI